MGISQALIEYIKSVTGKTIGNSTVLGLAGTYIKRNQVDYNKLVPEVLLKCNICGKTYIKAADSVRLMNDRSACISCSRKIMRESKMKCEIDYTGKKFGSFIILYRIGEWQGSWNTRWQAKCELCGKETSILDANLSDSIKCSCEISIKNLKIKQTIVSGTSLYKIYNDKPMPSNTSGTRGVYYNKRVKKWTAQISFQGKKRSLGNYNKIEDAIAARKKAEHDLYDSFIEQHREEWNTFQQSRSLKE